MLAFLFKFSLSIGDRVSLAFRDDPTGLRIPSDDERLRKSMIIVCFQNEDVSQQVTRLRHRGGRYRCD